MVAMVLNCICCNCVCMSLLKFSFGRLSLAAVKQQGTFIRFGTVDLGTHTAKDETLFADRRTPKTRRALVFSSSNRIEIRFRQGRLDQAIVDHLGAQSAWQSLPKSCKPPFDSDHLLQERIMLFTDRSMVPAYVCAYKLPFLADLLQLLLYAA